MSNGSISSALSFQLTRSRVDCAKTARGDPKRLSRGFSCRRFFSPSCAIRVTAFLFLLGIEAAVAEDAAQPAYPKFGLLRERDLTPFGFLRLDMRPAHAVWAPPGNWAVEVLLGRSEEH